jgi:hypothetical protein
MVKVKGLFILLIALLLSGISYGQAQDDVEAFNKAWGGYFSGANDGDTLGAWYEVQLYNNVEFGVECDDSAKVLYEFWCAGTSDGTPKFYKAATVAGDTVTFTSDAGGYKGFRLKGNGTDRLKGARFFKYAKKTLTGTSADTNGVYIKDRLIRSDYNYSHPSN